MSKVVENEYFLYKEKESIPHYWEEEKEIISKHVRTEKSARIFDARTNYSRFLDNSYLYKVILENAFCRKFLQQLSENNKRIYIYGAGRRGLRFLETFGRDINVAGFIDQDKSGVLNEKKIYSKTEYLKISDRVRDVILISCADKSGEIEKYFFSNEIPKDRIYSVEKLNKLAGKNIYFDNECLKGIKCEGAFVDCGAFDGADTISFFKWNQNESLQAIVIEPEIDNFRICMESLRHLNQVTLKQAGLSDKEGTAKINGEGIEANLSDCQAGNGTIEITTIDKICEKCKVGYIKMDIEGLEYKALIGARNTILRDHPILAISVYHKREDIIDIPKLILEIRDDYEFEFGHYTVGMTDTVLYAIPTD